ncbi:hypothetical protein C5B42_01445, partial [Candidatus Cerribacteria bacterium 'Amazon FNV 2010 28 9']
VPNATIITRDSPSWVNVADDKNAGEADYSMHVTMDYESNDSYRIRTVAISGEVWHYLSSLACDAYTTITLKNAQGNVIFQQKSSYVWSGPDLASGSVDIDFAVVPNVVVSGKTTVEGFVNWYCIDRSTITDLSHPNNSIPNLPYVGNTFTNSFDIQ